MENDLPLTVSWNAITDFFNCPVCMSNMKDTHMTVCGHRYCERCIRECIDRRQKCPCCNQVLQQDDIIRDRQFDELLNVSLKEKDLSEKNYFDNMINSVDKSSDKDLSNSLSPMKSVLRERLKKTFLSFEKYYQDLKEELSEKLCALDEKYELSKTSLDKEGLTNEINQKVEELRQEFDEQKRCLEMDFERTVCLVAKEYDKYLEEKLPDLSLLPVTVTLSILNKSVQMPNVCIKPHYSMEDIKDLYRHEMQAKGDKIIEFGEDTKFLCFSPLARKSLYEMHRVAEDIIEHHNRHEDVIVLDHQCTPLLQYHLKPGCDIAVFGQVKFESDLPKKCFTVTFDKEQKKAVDYFNCKDCKVNWVCRPCMEICHKDHNVAPYIMNHRPTWACCYCPKKNKCSIQNDKELSNR